MLWRGRRDHRGFWFFAHRPPARRGDADGQKEVTLTGKLLLPAEGGIDYFCLPVSARQA